MIVAIDGPAGSGKSTVSKLLSARLGALYLDSGAMYRTLALACMEEEVDTEDEDAVSALFKSIAVDQKMLEGRQIVFLNGRDVSEALRTLEVTAAVPPIAAMPRIREHMRVCQAAFGAKACDGMLVAEGRDMTTVVFADADVKFYIDASPMVRAQRRHDELKRKGIEVDIDELAREIESRDNSDIHREVGALKIAEDSVVVDTTGLDIDQVVDRLYEEVQSRKSR